MRRGPRAAPLIGLAAAAGLAGALWQFGRVALAVARGRRLAGASLPFSQPRAAPGAPRVLVVGDSTAVGVGAGDGRESLPGLLARRFPAVEVCNAASNGARVAETIEQLKAFATDARGFDLVIVMAGGNDALRHTRAAGLERGAEALLRALRAGPFAHTVWIGCADIAASPALPGPLRWWLGRRVRRVMRTLATLTARHGVPFIDFCDDAHRRFFGADTPRWFAEDGLHPSADSYRFGFETLCARLPLAHLLRRGRGLALRWGGGRTGAVSRAG